MIPSENISEAWVLLHTPHILQFLRVQPPIDCSVVNVCEYSCDAHRAFETA